MGRTMVKYSKKPAAKASGKGSKYLLFLLKFDNFFVLCRNFLWAIAALSAVIPNGKAANAIFLAHKTQNFFLPDPALGFCTRFLANRLDFLDLFQSIYVPATLPILSTFWVGPLGPEVTIVQYTRECFSRA